MVNTAVLVSGGGTNLQALIDARDSGILEHCNLALVVSSKPDAYALTRAENARVRSIVVDRKAYADRESFSGALLRVMWEYEMEFIIFAGFTHVLSKSFTDAFENRIINVHPSLIPAFCGDGFYGLRVHKAALDYGVKVTGATVHFVNEVTDGGQIIMQKAVDVLDGDTPEILQKRVMEQAEWFLLPQAAEMVCKQIAEVR